MFLYYSYRTREEIQEVRQTRDPITSFKQKILEADLATEDELKDLPILHMNPFVDDT
jgi:TPP-dependent pyruvate/acetoin dehydrogenase alpha subunit